MVSDASVGSAPVSVKSTLTDDDIQFSSLKDAEMLVDDDEEEEDYDDIFKESVEFTMPMKE